MKTLLKIILFAIIIVLFNDCKKETKSQPYSYKLVDVRKGAIEVYTKNDTVKEHYFTVDNIVGNDWLNVNTINEIYFSNLNIASLRFNQSDLKEGLDYLYSDLSVIYKNDSIFFHSIKKGLNDKNDTISVKGLYQTDSIKIIGVLFALNKTMPQGVEYGDFNKSKIFKKYGIGINDTLALFNFVLVFKK